MQSNVEPWFLARQRHGNTVTERATEDSLQIASGTPPPNFSCVVGSLLAMVRKCSVGFRKVDYNASDKVSSMFLFGTSKRWRSV